MSNEAIENQYFQTPVWLFEKPEWVKSVNKVCDKYIKEAYTRDLKDKKVKKNNDFGWSYHSSPLHLDPKLKKLHDWVGATSINFLDSMGYSLKNHTMFFTESWVQEFSKNGGGHHSTHVHWDNHISGFYFLKCSDKTSFPVMHDPRAGAMMTKLPQKDGTKLTPMIDKIHYRPKPGMLVFFPAYVPHEFAVDDGVDDFRFIHFNLQAIRNNIVNTAKGMK